MSNVDDLIKIITYYGGTASLEMIMSVFEKEQYVVFDTTSKRKLVETLKKSGFVRFNSANQSWELLCNNRQYLYVSDNIFFHTHEEVYEYVCDDKRPKEQRCYIVGKMNGKDAWFPKENDKDWDNKLSDDGLLFSFTSKKGEPIPTTEGKARNRYIFFYCKGPNGMHGYKFVGFFEQVSNDGITAKFKLVEDKVEITKRDTPLIICAISYMNHYNGSVLGDILVPRGSYGVQTGDVFEKKNFVIQSDGLVHGFVETKETRSGSGKYNTIALEEFDYNVSKKAKKASGVTVVFVAKPQNEKDFVVVGWYKNATIYRDRMTIGTDASATMMTCSPVNAFLVPHAVRDFKMPDGHFGSSFGIGTSNFYYIQSVIIDDKDANLLYLSLLDYINNYQGHPLMTFDDYLALAVKNGVLKFSSKKKYLECVNQINNELTDKYIGYDLLDVHDVDWLINFRKKMLDKTTPLGSKNASRNRSWSATLGMYISYLRGEEPVRESNLYYEPINLNKYPKFPTLKKADKETFLATKEMAEGDLLILYIGTQDKKCASGVYGIAKVISKPYIYHGDPKDICNNERSVDTEIISISSTPLVDADNFSRFILQYRSVQKISSNHYEELYKLLKL